MTRIVACPVLATLIVSAASVAAADPAGPLLEPCELEPFEGPAECGRFTVPEDRRLQSDPSGASAAGRTLDLAFTVVRGSAEGAPEPVFFLSGGPGEPGHGLTGLAGAFLRPVLEHRDFVFVDVRGTGSSGRLDCPWPELQSDPRVAFGELFPPDVLRRCRATLEKVADLRRYTTERIVDDLDALRAALGYERVLAWGGSYGTRVALTWLQRHPGSVAGVAVDGVAPAQNRLGLEFAADAQLALDRVLATCAGSEECAAAMPDLRGDLERLLARIDAGEVRATISPADGGAAVDVVPGRGHFGYAVRGMLYDPANVPRRAALIHEAAETGDLTTFAQAFYDREVRLWPYLAIGHYLSVVCAEDVPRYPGEDEIAALTEGTFLGDYLVRQYRAACALWPSGEVSDAFDEPITESSPVLLLSGAYDPSTPPRWADLVASHLPNSVHVVLSNGAHGTTRSDCGRDLTVRFLTTGSLEGLDASCGDQGPLELELGDPSGERL